MPGLGNRRSRCYGHRGHSHGRREEERKVPQHLQGEVAWSSRLGKGDLLASTLLPPQCVMFDPPLHLNQNKKGEETRNRNQIPEPRTGMFHLFPLPSCMSVPGHKER